MVTISGEAWDGPMERRERKTSANQNRADRGKSHPAERRDGLHSGGYRTDGSCNAQQSKYQSEGENDVQYECTPIWSFGYKKTISSCKLYCVMYIRLVSGQNYKIVSFIYISLQCKLYYVFKCPMHFGWSTEIKVAVCCYTWYRTLLVLPKQERL